MPKVHVYPVKDKIVHDTECVCNCWCEPEVIDLGKDKYGNDEKVFVHHKIKDIEKRNLKK